MISFTYTPCYHRELTLRLVLLSEKSMFVSQISEMLTSISQIDEQIPGMFGLF